MKTIFKKPSSETTSLKPASSWKEILIPLGFSSCSRAALRFAANSAADLGARLTVLHVVEPHVTGAIALDLAGLFRPDGSAAENELKVLLQDEMPRNVRSRQLMLHGAPAHEIVHIATEKKIDLIILPTHCRTGWQHARLGSVAEEVIKKAPCPVLVLPFPNTG